MTNPALRVAADFDRVPDYLKESPRWLLWKRQQRQGDKKPRKVPYYVNGQPRHAPDSPTDLVQLVTFNEAKQALERFPNRYAGLGFALGKDGHGGQWQGIDLDGLSRHPELKAEIEALPGYVECSPSGDGVHAIGYGQAFAAMGSDTSGVEAYCAGRYFTFTGHVIAAGPREDLSAILPRLEKHRKRQQLPAAKTVSNDLSWAAAYEIDSALSRDLRSALAYLDHDDYHEWMAVAHALKGGGDAGFEIWYEWSQRSDMFKTEEAKSKWDSIQDSNSGPGAIFKRAEKEGWLNPRKARRQESLAWGEPANDEKYAREFEFVSAGELLANLSPPKYLVDKYVEHGSLSLLFGEPGTGKSFLALDWSCCVATGTNWNGQAVLQGSVFYIAGEGHSGIGRRLKAWELHHDRPLHEAHLFVSRAAAALLDEASAWAVHRAVKALVDQHGTPAMIVIDTLHRNLGAGDENSAEDIAAFLDHIDQCIRKPFDCAILIVHHSGHSEKTRARGSSSIQGAMDSMFGLQNAGAFQKLTCVKQKDGEPPPDTYFSKKVIDLTFAMGAISGQSSLVLIPAAAEDVKSVRAVMGSAPLGLLRTLLNEQGVTPPVLILEEHPGTKAVVTVGAWRQRFMDSRMDGSIKVTSLQKAFLRECKPLYEQGVVRRSGDYVWVSD